MKSSFVRTRDGQFSLLNVLQRLPPYFQRFVVVRTGIGFKGTHGTVPKHHSAIVKNAFHVCIQRHTTTTVTHCILRQDLVRVRACHQQCFCHGTGGTQRRPHRQLQGCPFEGCAADNHTATFRILFLGHIQTTTQVCGTTNAWHI